MPRKRAQTAIPKRGKNGQTPTGKARLQSLDDLDRRTSAAQSVLATKRAIIADLGGDVSTVTEEIVANICVIKAMLNDAAAAYLQGQPVDKLGFAALANSQRRLIADIGLGRRAKTIVAADRLRSYIAATAEPVAA